MYSRCSHKPFCRLKWGLFTSINLPVGVSRSTEITQASHELLQYSGDQINLNISLAGELISHSKTSSLQNSCYTPSPGQVQSVPWSPTRTEKVWVRWPGCGVSFLSHTQTNTRVANLLLSAIQVCTFKILRLALILFPFPFPLPPFPFPFLFKYVIYAHLDSSLCDLQDQCTLHT